MKLMNVFEQETLLDLLGMAGRRPYLPMIVCCSTRDELDAVCSNVSNLSSCISVSSLVWFASLSFSFFFLFGASYVYMSLMQLESISCPLKFVIL